MQQQQQPAMQQSCLVAVLVLLASVEIIAVGVVYQRRRPSAQKGTRQV